MKTQLCFTQSVPYCSTQSPSLQQRWNRPGTFLWCLAVAKISILPKHRVWQSPHWDTHTHVHTHYHTRTKRDSNVFQMARKTHEDDLLLRGPSEVTVGVATPAVSLAHQLKRSWEAWGFYEVGEETAISRLHQGLSGLFELSSGSPECFDVDCGVKWLVKGRGSYWNLYKRPSHCYISDN